MLLRVLILLQKQIITQELSLATPNTQAPQSSTHDVKLTQVLPQPVSQGMYVVYKESCGKHTHTHTCTHINLMT